MIAAEKLLPKVDVYLAKAQPFAQPILEHLRDLVHQGCPNVEETIKWSRPFFEYRGAILCNMSAFKQHCAFGFWKGGRILGDTATTSSTEAMGQFGRITSLKDLPPKRVLLGYIKKVKQFNDANAEAPPKPRVAKKAPAIPPYFAAAVKKNKKALATFEVFPPGKRREYLEWLIEAETDATRQRRLETAIEWLAEGKSRNWKYEKCCEPGASIRATIQPSG